MNKTLIAALAAAALAGGAYLVTRPSQPDTATAPPTEGAAMVSVTLPSALSENALIGKRGFDANCGACHGENAAGKVGFGPPLIHKIYEPSHHGDMAFALAAQRGVRAHHWSFGNMPAQEGLTQADVGMITAYVRELQRANGID